MDVISSGNEYGAKPMSTKMLEDICDGSQSRPIINMREACYKICDLNKLGQAEWKGELLST